MTGRIVGIAEDSASANIHSERKMEALPTQVVQMLLDAKLVSLEVQYIDGTKI